MELVPISLKDANEFVSLHHRHHKPVVGHKFSVAAKKRRENSGGWHPGTSGCPRPG